MLWLGSQLSSCYYLKWFQLRRRSPTMTEICCCYEVVTSNDIRSCHTASLVKIALASTQQAWRKHLTTKEHKLMWSRQLPKFSLGATVWNWNMLLEMQLEAVVVLKAHLCLIGTHDDIQAGSSWEKYIIQKFPSRKRTQYAVFMLGTALTTTLLRIA